MNFLVFFLSVILWLSKQQQPQQQKTTKSCLAGAAAFNLSKDPMQDGGPQSKVLANLEGS